MASTIRGSDNFDSASKLTQATAVASTSGTYIDFTGIPSTAKRITVMFNGFSTNGTSFPLIQIGSGSIQTSGYASSSSGIGSGAATGTSTQGFLLYNSSISAADVRSGAVTILLVSNYVYVASGFMGHSNTNICIGVGGNVSLSGVLDRVRITTVNGTDTFDAGSINIMWEG